MIRRRLNGASLFIEETRGLGQQAGLLWKADGTTRIVNYNEEEKRSDANESGHRDNQDAEIHPSRGCLDTFGVNVVGNSSISLPLKERQHTATAIVANAASTMPCRD